MSEEEAAKEAGIPTSHRMKLVGQGTKGFMSNDDYWRFDQIDEQGRIVARWEALEHMQVRSSEITRSIKKISSAV